MRWHEILVRPAANRYACHLLSSAKNVVSRYEYAYMRDAECVPLSVCMHDDMCVALEGGKVEAAAGLVEDHWRFGMRAVENWLESASAGPSPRRA